MSALRGVLAAVRAAPPGTGLDDIARRLGLSRDEVDAMVDFWVRRGELTVEPLRGCPAGGCGARTRPGTAADGEGCAAGGPGCPLATPDGAPGRRERPRVVRNFHDLYYLAAAPVSR